MCSLQDTENSAGNVETNEECSVPQPVVNVVQNFNIRDVLMSAGIFETRRSQHEVTEQLENNIDQMIKWSHCFILKGAKRFF